MMRLGLIGDNIRASRSPMLHEECGRLHGIEVRYDLMIPRELGLSFDETFDRCREDGLAGFNVTLPYKETVLSRVAVGDPATARIGAVNTVALRGGRAQGFNTDCSGFAAAWRARFGDGPGNVVLIGAGGVGKAVGFALADLGATEIRVVDTDGAKAVALANALSAAGARAIWAGKVAAEAMSGAEGVVNATPLGMDGYPGDASAGADLRGSGWAFDAVYTPEFTPFRARAEAAGAAFLSGWELFFHQGIQAFGHFTGIVPTKLEELRRKLRES